MTCASCSREITEEDTYMIDHKSMCEDCAIQVGLFPLGRTGLSRDTISEKGRYAVVLKGD
jgi:hypothetical protein